MKKKLLTMLAICTALTLIACDSKETPNTDITTTTATSTTKATTRQSETTTAPTTEATTQQPETAAPTTEATTQQPETTEPTTAPTEASTPEPTKAPVELTWENSGLSYKVIETVNMNAYETTTDTLYLVTISNNHNDNTYHINTGVSYHIHMTNNCYLTPGNTFEFFFLTREDADTFVANITANPMKDLYVSISEPNGHWLFAPEKECTIISTEPYGNDKNITISCDDTTWYFERGMEDAIKEWYGFVTTTSFHFYDVNDNLVGVYAGNGIGGFYRNETNTITIRPDVDFTKVTAITFGQY